MRRLKFQYLVCLSPPPRRHPHSLARGCRLDDTGSCVTGTVRVLYVRVLLTAGSRRRNALRGTRLVSSTRSRVFLKSRTRSSTNLKTVKRSTLSQKAWTSSQGRMTSSTGLVVSATRTMRRLVLDDRSCSTVPTVYALVATPSPRFSNRGSVHTVETSF